MPRTRTNAYSTPPANMTDLVLRIQGTPVLSTIYTNTPPAAMDSGNRAIMNGALRAMAMSTLPDAVIQPGQQGTMPRMTDAYYAFNDPRANFLMLKSIITNVGRRTR